MPSHQGHTKVCCDLAWRKAGLQAIAHPGRNHPSHVRQWEGGESPHCDEDVAVGLGGRQQVGRLAPSVWPGRLAVFRRPYMGRNSP